MIILCLAIVASETPELKKNTSAVMKYTYIYRERIPIKHWTVLYFSSYFSQWLEVIKMRRDFVYFTMAVASD